MPSSTQWTNACRVLIYRLRVGGPCVLPLYLQAPAGFTKGEALNAVPADQRHGHEARPAGGPHRGDPALTVWTRVPYHEEGGRVRDTHTHTHTDTGEHTHTRIYRYIYTHRQTQTGKHTHIHIYIYIYINTHIQTNTYRESDTHTHRNTHTGK